MPADATGPDAPSHAGGPSRRKTITVVAAVIGGLVALALLWRLTPLREVADVERLAAYGRGLQDHPLGPVAAGLALAAAAVLFFPVTLLIGATAVLFSPYVGTLVALGGALVAASASWGLGRLTGRAPVGAITGPRLEALRSRVCRHGFVATVLARLLPVGNFAAINMLAGVIGIPLRDFAAGNVVGLLPGILAIHFFADRIERLVREPSAANIALALAAAAALVGLSWLLKRRFGKLTADV